MGERLKGWVQERGQRARGQREDTKRAKCGQNRTERKRKKQKVDPEWTNNPKALFTQQSQTWAKALFILDHLKAKRLQKQECKETETSLAVFTTETTSTV